MKPIYRTYLSLLVREIPNKSKLVIVPSASVARDAVKLGVDPTRIHVIPNGIFVKTYHNFVPLQAIKSAMEKRHSIRIVSTGRIVWYKGYEHAIRAIYELSRKMNIRIDYYVVGEIQDLRYFAILTSLARNLGMTHKVHFLGSVSEAVKLSVLKCADIYLAPSLYEGFGLTVVEAMAMSKPVIAANTAGHKDILKDHETGLLFMPGDVTDLSSRIYKLIRNPDLRETLTHNARIESVKYDWTSIIDRYEVAYKIGQN
jgi:glycosyltransferase involved in cell wall biosynthesis